MNKGNFKHGHKRNHRNSPTYSSWRNMWSRCTNPNFIASHRYSQRGITCCERWRDFSVFLEDMGVRPDDATLDRIDNSKGYSKENCRWASRKEQARNRDSNRLVTYGGVQMCITEWAELVGCSRDVFYIRMQRGFTEQAALETPVRKYRKKGNT